MMEVDMTNADTLMTMGAKAMFNTRWSHGSWNRATDAERTQALLEFQAGLKEYLTAISRT